MTHDLILYHTLQRDTSYFSHWLKSIELKNEKVTISFSKQTHFYIGILCASQVDTMQM